MSVAVRPLPRTYIAQPGDPSELAITLNSSVHSWVPPPAPFPFSIGPIGDRGAGGPSVDDEASSPDTVALATVVTASGCWPNESREIAAGPPELLGGPVAQAPELSKYRDDFCLPLFRNLDVCENFCWWLLLLLLPPPPWPPPPPQMLAPGRTFL